MPPKVSLAQRYRAHREAFTYALAHGITPREAAQKLSREGLAEMRRDAHAHLERIRSGQAPRAAVPSVSPQQAYENSERLLGEREGEQPERPWTPEP